MGKSITAGTVKTSRVTTDRASARSRDDDSDHSIQLPQHPFDGQAEHDDREEQGGIPELIARFERARDLAHRDGVVELADVGEVEDPAAR